MISKAAARFTTARHRLHTHLESREREAGITSVEWALMAGAAIIAIGLLVVAYNAFIGRKIAILNGG